MPISRHSTALPSVQLAQSTGCNGLDGITEIRIQGAGGTSPGEILGDLAPEQVSGDAVAGFYRTSDYRADDDGQAARLDVDRHVEAYSLGGLTSRGKVRVLWLVLLPFMLGNLAGWMCSAATRGSPWRFRLHRQACGLSALALTANAALVAVMISADIVAYQTSRAGLARHQWWLAPLGWRYIAGHPARQVMLGVLVPVLLILALAWLTRRSWRYEAVRPPRSDDNPAELGKITAAALPGGLADGGFWDGEGSVRLLTRLHVAVAVGFLAVVLGIVTSALTAGSRHGALGWIAIATGGLTVALGVIAVIEDALGTPPAESGPAGWLADVLRRSLTVLPILAAAALVLACLYAWLQPAGQPGQVTQAAELPGLSGVIGITALAIAIPVAMMLISTVLGLRGTRKSLIGGSWVTLMLAFSVLNTVMLAAQTWVAHLVGPVTSDATAALGRSHGKIYLPSVITSGVPLVVWAAALAILSFGTNRVFSRLLTVRLPSGNARLYQEEAAAFREQQTGPRKYWYWSGLPPFPPPGYSTGGQGAGRKWERKVARAQFLGRSPHDVAWLPWSIVLAELVAAAIVWRFRLQLPTAIRDSGVALAGLALPSLMIFLYVTWAGPGRCRTLGILWDIGTFWPRSYHPFSPPCYAERAVPELQRRMWWLHDGGGRVILVAHGHGAMLATAALVQTTCRPQNDCPALVTLGSPVSKLYAWGFPAYVNDGLLAPLEPGQAARLNGWRNIYYPTDPIGGPVRYPGDVQVDQEFLDPETSCYIYGMAPPAPSGHFGYWADRRVWAEVDRLAAELPVAAGTAGETRFSSRPSEAATLPPHKRSRLVKRVFEAAMAAGVGGAAGLVTAMLANVAFWLVVVVGIGVFAGTILAFGGAAAISRRVQAGTGEGGSGLPAEYVKRHVVVTGPETVAEQGEFAITAALLRQLPAGLPPTPPLKVQLTVDAEGSPTRAPAVSVVIYASKAFDMLSDPKVELPVIPDGDPDPATFSLRCRPGVTGLQEVSVVAYQDYLVIGAVKVVITIGNGLPPARPVQWTLSVPAMPGEGVAAPEVVIRVSRVTFEGRDTLHYSYQWQARGGQSIEAGSVELKTTVDEWLRERLEKLGVAANQPVLAIPSGTSAEAANARKYEKIGENLYEALFTKELRAFYSQFAPDTQTLLIFSDEPWIPWELVKPWNINMDGDFLCAQFDMSRWYYSNESQVPKGMLDVREIAPVLPSSDLAHVGDEADYFERLPEKWPAVSLSHPLPVRYDEVVAVLTGGRAQVLHFGTHGWLRGQDGIAHIVLDDGNLLAEDLVGHAIAVGLGKATPFVFMNACHSGRQAVGLTRADGWVERCLDLGCRAFLGANWEVNDELAAQFAIEVYDRLVQGATIAQAVRQARWVLRNRDASNPTWLAYTLYAHPNLTVRPTP